MKTQEYKYIEYTDDNDHVIANVVMDEDKIVSVKRTESCLTNKTEFIELTTFMNTIAPMPWKYDDNEQACEDWYTTTNITGQVTNTPEVSDQKHVYGPYIDVDVVAHRCTKCGKTLIYEVNISTDKLKFIGMLGALE